MTGSLEPLGFVAPWYHGR